MWTVLSRWGNFISLARRYLFALLKLPFRCFRTIIIPPSRADSYHALLIPVCSPQTPTKPVLLFMFFTSGTFATGHGIEVGYHPKIYHQICLKCPSPDGPAFTSPGHIDDRRAASSGKAPYKTTRPRERGPAYTLVPVRY